MPGTKLAVVMNVVPAKVVAGVAAADVADNPDCEAASVAKLPGETVADAKLDVIELADCSEELIAVSESLPRALASATGIDVKPNCTLPFVTNCLAVEAESVGTVKTVVETAFGADDSGETELCRAAATSTDLQGWV